MNRFRLSAVLLVFVISIGCISCKQATDEPDKATGVSTLLRSGPWKMNTVSVDGVSKDNYLTGLTLSFSQGTLSVANGGAIFGASSSWSLSNDASTIVTSKLSIDIVTLTGQLLVVEFTSSTLAIGPGRSSSLKGVHKIAFEK